MKKNAICKALVLVLSLPILAVFDCDATTMLKFSVKELSDRADCVVVGKVTAKESRWNEDRTKIYTYTNISSLCSEKMVGPELRERAGRPEGKRGLNSGYLHKRAMLQPKSGPSDVSACR